AGGTGPAVRAIRSVAGEQDVRRAVARQGLAGREFCAFADIPGYVDSARRRAGDPRRLVVLGPASLLQPSAVAVGVEAGEEQVATAGGAPLLQFAGVEAVRTQRGLLGEAAGNQDGAVVADGHPARCIAARATEHP